MEARSLYVREAHAYDMSAVTALQQSAYCEMGYIAGQCKSGVQENGPAENDTVIIACIHNEENIEHIVGTLSVTEYADINESPLIKDFPETLQRIGKKREKCAVIWRLAIAQEYRHEFHIVFLLIDAAIGEGVYRDVVSVICAIHPNHYSFYRKCIGLRKIDECANLTGLVNAPAFLLFGKYRVIRRKFLCFCQRRKNLRRRNPL